MVAQMDKDQRRMVQDALGLSDVVMISLQNGVKACDAGIARAGELYGEFGRATEAAREYNRVLAELNTQFGGIGETLAEKMLPAFTGVLQSTSDFISDNRGLLEGYIDRAAENPIASSAIAGGAAATGAGAALRGLGLRGVGTALTRL